MEKNYNLEIKETKKKKTIVNWIHESRQLNKSRKYRYLSNDWRSHRNDGHRRSLKRLANREKTQVLFSPHKNFAHYYN